MAPPKVSTRKVTLDGGITKFQNEKLTTLASEKRLFQRWCSGTYTIFFYFCYVCCCCNNSAVDGTPLGLVYGASHQAKINRFKYGCISISSDFLISHQFCYNSKEEEGMSFTANYTRRRGPFSSQKSFEKIHKKEKDLVWLLKGFFGFCMRSFMRLGFAEKSLHIIYESVLNACFVLISVLPTL